MVDMAHIAGLVAVGFHPNPVEYADVVTSTTHKTLRGPRGGLILCKEKYAQVIDKAIFPGTQGGPLMHVIAAKAVCFKEALKPDFKTYQEQIIKNSKEIMNLLSRDNIKIEEVSDYHIYPIADNDTPMLSADRLEYTLSGGLYQVRVFELEDIKKHYGNIIIAKNEKNIDELSFKDINICENFIHDISKLWPRWIEDEDRACMQFIADVMKWLNREGYVTIDDLYKLSEKEVIKLIENCKDSYIRNAFKNFRDATKDSVYKSDEPNDKIYCTSVKGKKRYINPLVKCDSKFYRIYDVSNQAKEDIENFKNMKMYQYIGFEFDFKT